MSAEYWGEGGTNPQKTGTGKSKKNKPKTPQRRSVGATFAKKGETAGKVNAEGTGNGTRLLTWAETSKGEEENKGFN